MKHLVFYLISILLVLLSIEILLFFVPNNYSYKANYLKVHSKEIKTLILGASQAENCINPNILSDSCFNFGGSGKPYYFDMALVKEYISEMPNLKYIVMTVSPIQQYRSYRHNISPNDNLTAMESYIRCMHLRYLGIHYNPFDYWYYLQLPNDNGNVYAKITIGVTCDSLGYTPFDRTNRMKDWQHNQLPKPIDYTNEELPKAYEENLSYLKELAQLCKNNKVKLVFISIPYHKLAREALPKVDMQSLYKLMNSLKEVNPNIDYRNYIYDSRFNDDDFYNSIHLASEGSDKFSQILHNDIFLNRIIKD